MLLACVGLLMLDLPSSLALCGLFSLLVLVLLDSEPL